MPPNRNSRLYQYRRQRRNFAIKVYAITAIFILITFAQWFIINEVYQIDAFFEEHYYVALMGLFASLLLASVFVFFENIRFIIPINWILGILIVECVTAGLARTVAMQTLTMFIWSLTVTLLVVVLLIVAGVFMKHDLTLDVVILFVIAIIFFIGAVFFAMLHIITETPYSMYFYSLFVGSTVMLFTMYHAQTINGSRYAEMRLKDYLLASLIIYHDFIILFMLVFYLLPALEGQLPSFDEWSNKHRPSTTTEAAIADAPTDAVPTA